jgi:hypothetical protein
MRRSHSLSALCVAVATAALVLTACGGGSAASETAASASAAGSAPVIGSPAPSAGESLPPVDAASNTVTYSNAVFDRMSTVAIEPNCQSPTAYLSASYDAEAFSCSLTLDRATLFDEVCTSDDAGLTFASDPTAGTCTMTSNNTTSVKAGCDAIVADETVTAAFDEATASCVLTVKPEALIEGACNPATVDPLESKIDETGLTCTLSLTAPVVYAIVAEAVNSGDIACDDDSPRNSPSEECVLAALNKVDGGE